MLIYEFLFKKITTTIPTTLKIKLNSMLFCNLSYPSSLYREKKSQRWPSLSCPSRQVLFCFGLVLAGQKKKCKLVCNTKRQIRMPVTEFSPFSCTQRKHFQHFRCGLRSWDWKVNPPHGSLPQQKSSWGKDAGKMWDTLKVGTEMDKSQETGEDGHRHSMKCSSSQLEMMPGNTAHVRAIKL